MIDFEKLPQFVRGKNVEEFLDLFFEMQGFTIRKTSPQEERVMFLGDREFITDHLSIFVEYKSGIQTHYTGNIFIETISVDKPDHFKKGWLYTCQADFIAYATIYDGCILLIKPDDLRKASNSLKRKFREVSTSNNQNAGYNTHGIIVPLVWAKENLACLVLPL